MSRNDWFWLGVLLLAFAANWRLALVMAAIVALQKALVLWLAERDAARAQVEAQARRAQGEGGAALLKSVRAHLTNNPPSREEVEAFEEAQRFFNSTEWQRLHAEAISESGSVCSRCGRRFFAGDLTVQHVKDRLKHPELAFEKTNLHVVCVSCIAKAGEDATREKQPGLWRLVSEFVLCSLVSVILTLLLMATPEAFNWRAQVAVLAISALCAVGWWITFRAGRSMVRSLRRDPA